MYSGWMLSNFDLETYVCEEYLKNEKTMHDILKELRYVHKIKIMPETFYRILKRNGVPKRTPEA